jgi:hypothetical protein
MTREYMNRDEQRLGERLRREAAESRPAFSEDLHARMVRAVRRSGARKMQPAGELAASWCSMRRVRLAVAGACLVAAAAIGWQWMRMARPPADLHTPSPRNEIAAPAAGGPDDLTRGLAAVSELGDRMANQVDRMLASGVVLENVAYLNDDARRAVRGLVAPLPVDFASVDGLSPEDRTAN